MPAAALATPPSLAAEVLKERKSLAEAMVTILELQQTARFYIWMHTLARNWYEPSTSRKAWPAVFSRFAAQVIVLRDAHDCIYCHLELLVGGIGARNF